MKATAVMRTVAIVWADLFLFGAYAVSASNDAPLFSKMPTVAATSQHDFPRRWLEDTQSPELFATDLDQAFRRSHAETSTGLQGEAGAETLLKIDVVFHVLSGPASEGDLSESRLVSQVSVLNNAYRPAGIEFNLAQVRRYPGSRYFAGGCYFTSEQSIQMRSELAVDPAGTINIYTCKLLLPYLAGAATFPNEFPEADTRHGIVIDYGTVTGSSPPLDVGNTLVHELGHYFGLLHTFQGGCEEPGDGIPDTPAEASPAYGCPLGRDSCPQEGADPVSNFMDYSDDICMDGFTLLQNARMRALISTYRPSLTASPFSISPGITGNWYDPAQNGHGIQVEVLPNNVATAFWFTFDDAGKPVWITGAGTISGHQVAMNAARLLNGRFPPNFNPDVVERRHWGTLSFEFTDCNHGSVSWNSTDPAFTPTGTMTLQRLTSISGLTCQ